MEKPLIETINGVEHFRGLPLVRRSIVLAGRTFRMVALRDAADLLDEPDFAQRFIEEDKAPYGVELWPAAQMLGEYILTNDPGQGRSAVEIGAGLGLVSIAAAAAGWSVTLTDHEETALQFASLNAEANGADITSFDILDWHHPPAGRRFTRVFAADVLYQLVDHMPLLRTVRALLSSDGMALIADPNRGIADRFPGMAEEHGFTVETEACRAENESGRMIEGRVFVLRPGR